MSPKNRKRQALLKLAHSLRPIIIIGNQGLTEGVLAETDRALFDHELIKVRINAEDKAERMQMRDALVEKLNAECVKTIGHIVVLYRPATPPRLSF